MTTRLNAWLGSVATETIRQGAIWSEMASIGGAKPPQTDQWKISSPPQSKNPCSVSARAMYLKLCHRASEASSNVAGMATDFINDLNDMGIPNRNKRVNTTFDFTTQ